MEIPQQVIIGVIRSQTESYLWQLQNTRECAHLQYHIYKHAHSPESAIDRHELLNQDVLAVSQYTFVPLESYFTAQHE